MIKRLRGALAPPPLLLKVLSVLSFMDPMGSHIALRQGITTGLELEMGVTNAKQLRSVYETRGSPQ